MEGGYPLLSFLKRTRYTTDYCHIAREQHPSGPVLTTEPVRHFTPGLRPSMMPST